MYRYILNSAKHLYIANQLSRPFIKYFTSPHVCSEIKIQKRNPMSWQLKIHLSKFLALRLFLKKENNNCVKKIPRIQTA